MHKEIPLMTLQNRKFNQQRIYHNTILPRDGAALQVNAISMMWDAILVHWHLLSKWFIDTRFLRREMLVTSFDHGDRKTSFSSMFICESRVKYINCSKSVFRGIIGALRYIICMFLFFGFFPVIALGDGPENGTYYCSARHIICRIFPFISGYTIWNRHHKIAQLLLSAHIISFFLVSAGRHILFLSLSEKLRSVTVPKFHG